MSVRHLVVVATLSPVPVVVNSCIRLAITERLKTPIPIRIAGTPPAEPKTSSEFVEGPVMTNVSKSIRS